MTKDVDKKLFQYPTKVEVGLTLPRITLGQIWRTERRRHGLKSVEMAKNIKVTKGYYSQLERNIDIKFPEQAVKSFHSYFKMTCCLDTMLYKGKNIPKKVEKFIHSYGEFIHPFFKLWMTTQPKKNKYDFYKKLFEQMVVAFDGKEDDDIDTELEQNEEESIIE